MKRIFLALLSVLLFVACQSKIDTYKVENDKLKEALKMAQTEIADLKSADDLVHIVYFNLNEQASVEGLITEIKKLKAIEVVHNLEVGTFQDLGDARAMSYYGVMMQMEFKNEGDYKIYQTHPIHLALKKAVMPYFDGPPATYDYWEK